MLLADQRPMLGVHRGPIKDLVQICAARVLCRARQAQQRLKGFADGTGLIWQDPGVYVQHCRTATKRRNIMDILRTRLVSLLAILFTSAVLFSGQVWAAECEPRPLSDEEFEDLYGGD